MKEKTKVVPWEATPFALDIPSFAWPARVTYPLLMRRLYPQASALLGVSADCISTLADVGVRIEGIPSAVVPYPVNVEEVERWSRQETRQLSLGKWKYVIVASGRLHPHKGHDVLLHAVAKLRAEGLDVGVVILGEGSARGHLESLVDTLNLADAVLLPGHIRPPHPVYKAATVFVHPSRWEGFGMSLIEAMALGAPVVATSCPGGPKEILDGGRYGLLVPPDDPSALARAIGSLIRDEKLRLEMARLARLRAEAYGPEQVADRMVEAIAPCLS